MKIIKEEIEQEVTSNEIKDDQYKEETEKAKEEAEDIIDPMERKNEKAFLGAKKQPEPKEPEEPKAALDESLFEDYNESLNEVKIIPHDNEALKESINTINWYYHRDLKRFLESMAYNCPLGTERGEGFIVDLAEFLSDVDESLNEDSNNYFILVGSKAVSANSFDDAIRKAYKYVKQGKKEVTVDSNRSNFRSIDFTSLSDFNDYTDILNESLKEGLQRFEISYVDNTGAVFKDFVRARSEEEAKELFLDKAKSYKTGVKKIKGIYLNDPEDFEQVCWDNGYFDESLKEDLNEADFSNFNSAFYNAITDVLYKYRDHEDITRNDIERAYAFFDSHFYDSDDNYGVEESLFEDANSDSEMYDQVKEVLKDFGLKLPKDIFNVILNYNGIKNDMEMQDESLKEAVGQEEVDRLYDYVSDYIYHYYDEVIKNMSQEEIDQFISDLSSTMKDYASHWQEENESLKESLTTEDREEAIEYIDDFLSKYDFYSELDAEDAKYICSSLETIMLDHIFWLDKLRKENEEDEEDRLEEARSKKQKEEENTLWDRVYSELASGKDTAVEGPHKIKAGKSDRYRYDDQIFIPDDGIGVHVETKDDLKFAKKVADHFGLEFKSYSEPCNQGTKTAWAGVVIIPEDMYEETPEETAARLAKK